MYESYFGLSLRPFAATPVVERFFPASSIDTARQTLSRCIDRAEGVGVCIGAAGMGKTLLLEVLADQFSEPFGAVMLSAGAWASRRELLQAICFELKIPYQGLDEGELRLALVNQLTRTEKHRRGIVLLVDEAHTLSVPLLEELRMLSNLVHGGEPRVRLVIAGNLRLEEQLASPQLESFSQRLACRTYLEPFDRAETTDYVRFQIAVAGGRVEQVFEPAAVDAVYRATDGIPRLVNQLCDHALLMAYSQEQRPVTVYWVDKAWADLQQLPVPWQEPLAGQAGGGVSSIIEFGALSDELDDASAAAGQAMPNAEVTGEIEAASHQQDQSACEEETTSHAGAANRGEVEVEGAADGAGNECPGEACAHDEVSQVDTGQLEVGQMGEAAQSFEQACEGEPQSEQPNAFEAYQDGAEPLSDPWAFDADADDPVRLAEARFEELASQFETLQAEDDPGRVGEFTEAELNFEDEDPFDTFDEEEPLVDPYAALEAAAWGGQASVPLEDDPVSPHDAVPPHDAVSPSGAASLEDRASPVGEIPANQNAPEPPVASPAAQNEPPQEIDPFEASWEDAEEWSVHDTYRDAQPFAGSEIAGVRSTAHQTQHDTPCQGHGADDCDVADHWPHEAARSEPEVPCMGENLDASDPATGAPTPCEATDEPHADSDGEKLAEVVVDPYEGLNELGERLRQEAMRLAGPDHQPAAPLDSSQCDASIPVSADLEQAPGEREAGPIAGADIVEIASASAGNQVEQVAEDPVEFSQEKLTLAEAIRRRKQADAVVTDSPMASGPTGNDAAYRDETTPDGGFLQYELQEQVDSHGDDPQALAEDDAGHDSDQVVIVLDDDEPEGETASDAPPRVQREDYRTLFEKLRRG